MARGRVSRIAAPVLAAALTAAGGYPVVPAAAAPRRVAVLTDSRVPAYQQASEALIRGLSSPAVIDAARLPGPDALSQQLRAARAEVLVAVGSHPAAAVAAAGAPVISTMTVDRQAYGSHAVGGVTLEAPLSEVLLELAAVWPGKKRIGVLRGATPESLPRAEAVQQARRAGFEIVTAACAGPDRILDALLGLKGRVDFVWCPPDAALFNATTIPAMLMAALRNGLAVIGFSESFVKAGAAAGVYPDYAEVGRQTADLVARYGASQPVIGFETPRRLKVAVNERVLRLIGLELPKNKRGGNPFLTLQ